MQISLPKGVTGKKFSHELSHCMKAVDFIIETPNCLLLIEVKDPEHPEAREKNRDEFIEGFEAGKLDDELKYKYRDSFLYLWAEGRLKPKKPVLYAVLIAISKLESWALIRRTDALKRQLPVRENSPSSWKHYIAEGCGVLNIEAWNKHKRLSKYPVSRVNYKVRKQS